MNIAVVSTPCLVLYCLCIKPASINPHRNLFRLRFYQQKEEMSAPVFFEHYKPSSWVQAHSRTEVSRKLHIVNASLHAKLTEITRAQVLQPFIWVCPAKVQCPSFHQTRSCPAFWGGWILFAPWFRSSAASVPWGIPNKVNELTCTPVNYRLGNVPSRSSSKATLKWKCRNGFCTRTAGLWSNHPQFLQLTEQ